MRLKLFFLTAAILTMSVLAVSVIHFHFFQQERLQLIRLNLEQNANLLMNSDLSYNRQEFREKGDRILERIMGDDKFNVIIGLYNAEGKALYLNDNARIFSLPQQTSLDNPEWEDIETKDYFLKILTRVDQKDQKIIRVGMILNQSLLRWKDLSQRIFWYVFIVLMLVILLSFLLTDILFRPVDRLTSEIEKLTLDANYLDQVRSKLDVNSEDDKGEVGRLAQAVTRLVSKSAESQTQLRRWSAMMAHELKTPLTVMKNQVEGFQMGQVSTQDLQAHVSQQVDQLGKIVENFLGWITLDTHLGKDQVIHAVKIQETVEGVLASLGQDIYSTISKDFKANPVVFCDPIHFEMVMTNLVLNAYRYGEAPISILVLPDEVRVKDGGIGPSADVIARLGQPFNGGGKSRQAVRGHGLGLAWVKTICSLYAWELSYSGDEGCCFSIRFPREN